MRACIATLETRAEDRFTSYESVTLDVGSFHTNGYSSDGENKRERCLLPPSPRELYPVCYKRGAIFIIQLYQSMMYCSVLSKQLSNALGADNCRFMPDVSGAGWRAASLLILPSG